MRDGSALHMFQGSDLRLKPHGRDLALKGLRGPFMVTCLPWSLQGQATTHRGVKVGVL